MLFLISQILNLKAHIFVKTVTTTYARFSKLKARTSSAQVQKMA